MARSSSSSVVAAAAVLLVVLGCGLVASADAAKVAPKKVPVAFTKGALPFRELVFPLQKFKYRYVPYFPGTTFITTDCTPHDGERKITVSASKISLTNGGGLLGGYTRVEYEFKTATLRVVRSAGGPKAPALSANLYLNYLIDSESPSDIVAFAASGRKTAISLLHLLRGSLAPFAARNTQDQCAVMGRDKRAPVYNPKVQQLVAYLKEVSDILAAV